MAGSCCRIRVPVATSDTDCIGFSGVGSPLDPLVATPVIPASIPHPLFGAGFPVDNGVACVPGSGFETGPYGFVGGGGGSLPIGSLPPIIVDTPPGPFPGGPAGNVAWGSALSVSMPNPSVAGQFFVAQIVTTHPVLIVTLEPGAGFSYGFTSGCPDPIGAPFFTIDTDGYVNAGTSTISFTFEPTVRIDSSLLSPFTALDVCVASTVALFGSSGASSVVSSVFGSGIDIALFGGTL